jgi:hypothetical protein
MTNQKKQDKPNEGINPIVVGVAGAVVGAGIAVAGAMALKDDKNRAKVMGALKNVKDQALDIVDGMQNQVEDKKEIVEGKVKKALKTTKKS